MNLQSLKLQLIDLLLQTEKESVLERIKSIFEEESRVPESFYQMLDKDRENHLNENSPSYEWEDVKKRIEKKYAK